ncbi:MAG: hypothetical protein ACLUW6_07535 [Coriobacteriaceae bacterium]
MTYLMEIDNLGKRYDDFELSGVSLAVERAASSASSDRTALARPPSRRRGSSPREGTVCSATPRLQRPAGHHRCASASCWTPPFRHLPRGRWGYRAGNLPRMDAAQFAALCDRFNLAPKVSELSRGMGIS